MHSHVEHGNEKYFTRHFRGGGNPCLKAVIVAMKSMATRVYAKSNPGIGLVDDLYP